MCVKCFHVQEDSCSVDERLVFAPKCEKCGSICHYKFTPTLFQFALKDGPSGSWVSKGLRYQKHRAKQHELAGKRQRERYGDIHKLVPNYSGNDTGTWSEAQFQAAKDKGPKAASTYANLVLAEKKIS
jgi:hypothetical protein